MQDRTSSDTHRHSKLREPPEIRTTGGTTSGGTTSGGTTSGGTGPEIAAEALLAAYRSVRARTDWICEPLSIEDHVLQCMPDASPTRWHLAHTTWFFERFILQEFAPGYVAYDEKFYFLFNSYYQALGPRHARSNRGQLSRPTVAHIRAYRQAIDARLAAFVEGADDALRAKIAPLLTLGCNHEQQHQELMLTDLMVNLWHNPLMPAYRDSSPTSDDTAPALHWVRFDGGVVPIGVPPPGTAADPARFHYDNEGPRHDVLLRPFALASRPTTNEEFLAFVKDGGYQKPEYWLDLGYARVRDEDWAHPLYWFERDGTWMQYTMSGPQALALHEPVCHLSFFEADAFARWAGHRLPLEAEWETAAADLPLRGNLFDQGLFRPAPAPHGEGLQQMFGDVWEWTASPYVGYPGYRPAPGAVGEYNGKFMCNQYVLRGGSFATSRDHLRRTYRNFFPPEARWQIAGLRLAKDV